MFSWFFRKSSPVESHTSFVDDKTWIAELNSADQLQTVKELFAMTFDSDNFIVIDEDKSVTAILGGDEKYQCTLTFGYNGDNTRIAVISYIDDEDQTIVKPSINAFAVELENYSLLLEQPVKEQKPIDTAMVSMKDVVYEKDIIIDDQNNEASMILRENVDIKRMLVKLTKLFKEKCMLEAKTENGKLCFTEKGNDKFKITVQVGRNSDKQRVMALTANESRVYWKELIGAVVDVLMKGKCLHSYSLTAQLRKNLHQVGTKAPANTAIVEPATDAVQVDVSKEAPTEKKEEEKQPTAIEIPATGSEPAAQ